MNDKPQIITMLRDEFDRWEKLVTALSEYEITAPNRVEKLSIKDTLAHLMAWQQRSIARMDAARQNKEPVFPKWSTELDPNSEEELDKINAWIYQTYLDRSWADVHQAWKDGYLRFMALGEAVPEKDLLNPGRYLWLDGYPLSVILTSSYEHHEEHLEPLLAMFHRH